jgi:hypothetical protein
MLQEQTMNYFCKKRKKKGREILNESRKSEIQLSLFLSSPKLNSFLIPY